MYFLSCRGRADDTPALWRWGAHAGNKTMKAARAGRQAGRCWLVICRKKRDCQGSSPSPFESARNKDRDIARQGRLTAIPTTQEKEGEKRKRKNESPLSLAFCKAHTVPTAMRKALLLFFLFVMTKGQGKKKDKEQHGQTTPALGPRPQPVDHQKSHKKARVADFSRGGRALLCHASFFTCCRV